MQGLFPFFRTVLGDWPAAWAYTCGLGKVVFLMPGHHLPSFQLPEVAKLLRGGPVGGWGEVLAAGLFNDYPV